MWGGQIVCIEHDYYFKSDNVNLILDYSPIVMSMSSSYAYSLCVNRYWGTKWVIIVASKNLFTSNLQVFLTATQCMF